MSARVVRKIISKLGLVTGGAGSEVAKIAAAGLDTFITGEGPHWSFPLAEELGLNIFLRWSLRDRNLRCESDQ